MVRIIGYRNTFTRTRSENTRMCTCAWTLLVRRTFSQSFIPQTTRSITPPTRNMEPTKRTYWTALRLATYFQASRTQREDVEATHSRRTPLHLRVDRHALHQLICRDIPSHLSWGGESYYRRPDLTLYLNSRDSCHNRSSNTVRSRVKLA